MLRTTWLAGILATAVCCQHPWCGSACAEPPKVAASSRSQPRRAASEKRREWLFARLSAGLRDQAAAVELKARLARMSPRQIEQLSAHYLDELRKRRERAKQTGDRPPRFERQAATGPGPNVGARHRGGRPPGFMPVITWLPAGASLTTSAVVSPDGRHVRIRAMPFFSTIGPVHAFNFFTGESFLLHPGPPDPFGHPPPQPRVWHDGLRTRP